MGGNRSCGLRATMKRGRVELDVLLLVDSEVVGVWYMFRRASGEIRAFTERAPHASPKLLVTGRNKPDNASDNFNQKLSSANWTRK